MSVTLVKEGHRLLLVREGDGAKREIRVGEDALDVALAFGFEDDPGLPENEVWARALGYLYDSVGASVRSGEPLRFEPSGALECPECGNRKEFTGWIEVLQRVDLCGDGTYEEALGEDDLDARGGDLSRSTSTSVAHDVTCRECGLEIGEVSFAGSGAAGEELSR